MNKIPSKDIKASSYWGGGSGGAHVNADADEPVTVHLGVAPLAALCAN